MDNFSDHLRGLVRVPLGSLTAQDVVEIPQTLCNSATVAQLEQLLANPSHPQCAVVNRAQLNSIEEEIGPLTLSDTLKNGSDPPRIRTPVRCLLGQYCIEQARRVLGAQFLCNIKLYYIPQGCNDGLIFRNVREHMREGNLDLAQQWMWKLKGRKSNHLGMLLGRPEIMAAMDAVAQFTGLWDDFRLGNWAKHLAAHCDRMIVYYWKHIHRAWASIFDGVESSPGLLDPETVRGLQYLAPAWSECDRTFIRESMTNGLFVNISSPRDRTKLLENILKLDVVIPSILTFDENMRYVTIGAKILEKHTEVKRKKNQKDTPRLRREPECLFSNLKHDWEGRGYLETDEGQFDTHPGDPDSWAAFADLFLAALREFPFRSSVSPLQDVKGQEMIAAPNPDSLSWLCKGAEIRGFRNKKIAKGAELFQNRLWSRSPTHNRPHKTWRGGTPSIRQFWSLRDGFYLPSLANLDYSQSISPNQACIQRDFVNAFFGPLPPVQMDSSRRMMIELRAPCQASENATAWRSTPIPANEQCAEASRADISMIGTEARESVDVGMDDSTRHGTPLSRAKISKAKQATRLNGAKTTRSSNGVPTRNATKADKRRQTLQARSSLFMPELPEVQPLPIETDSALVDVCETAQSGDPTATRDQLDPIIEDVNQEEQVLTTGGFTGVNSGSENIVTTRLHSKQHKTSTKGKQKVRKPRPSGVNDVSQLSEAFLSAEKLQNGSAHRRPATPEPPPELSMSINIHKGAWQVWKISEKTQLCTSAIVGTVANYLNHHAEAFSSIAVARVWVGDRKMELSTPVEDLWPLLSEKLLLSRGILDTKEGSISVDVTVTEPTVDTSRANRSLGFNWKPYKAAEPREEGGQTLKARKLTSGKSFATETVMTGPSQSAGTGRKRATEDHERQVEIRRDRPGNMDLDLPIPELNEAARDGENAIAEMIGETEEE